MGGRQPRPLLLAVVVVSFAVAIVQASQHGQWSTVIVLSSLLVFPVACPLADAAISRASERAADRYAVHAGFGPDLARALDTISTNDTQRRRLSDAFLARHPLTARRIRDLDRWSMPDAALADSPAAIAA